MYLLWPRRKQSTTSGRKEVLLGLLPVPVHLFVEKRRNSRVSLLTDKVHIRIPYGLTVESQQNEFQRLLKWAELRINRDNVYDTKDYVSNPHIVLAGRSWKLEFRSTDLRKWSIYADPDNGRLTICWNADPTSLEGREKIRELLIRFAQENYYDHIHELVSQINDETIGATVGNIRLRYLRSRWGSCSASGNISLSVRLLLVPAEVLRYVIIHELAHRVHMNHSNEFWSLVGRHMPRFQEHENWLNKNGRFYDF